MVTLFELLASRMCNSGDPLAVLEKGEFIDHWKTEIRKDYAHKELTEYVDTEESHDILGP